VVRAGSGAENGSRVGTVQRVERENPGKRSRGGAGEIREREKNERKRPRKERENRETQNGTIQYMQAVGRYMQTQSVNLW